MTLVQVKKLFRRCLLIATIGVATGCASVKQMPSTSTVVEDSNKVVADSNKVVAVIEAPASAPSELVKEDSLGHIIPFLETKQVSTKNLALEKSTDTDILVKHLVTNWKVSPLLAREIVMLAEKNARADFPKRNDILAIIAVESSYNPKASFRGSHGLMQIEKKSHLDKLKGRNIFNVAVNIELGATVLYEYFQLVGKNVKATLLSYNAGIGNYKKGRYRLEYYTKYKKQLALLPKV